MSLRFVNLDVMILWLQVGNRAPANDANDAPGGGGGDGNGYGGFTKYAENFGFGRR